MITQMIEEKQMNKVLKEMRRQKEFSYYYRSTVLERALCLIGLHKYKVYDRKTKRCVICGRYIIPKAYRIK